jgi:hypothetical protein
MFLFVEPVGEGTRPMSIVVASDGDARDDSLQAYAWRKSFDISRSVSSFELVESRAERAAGCEAMRMHIRWRDDRESHEQVIVYVKVPDLGVFTFTCNLSGAPEERWRPVLDRLIETARFPAPAAPELRSSTPAPMAMPHHLPTHPIPMPGERAVRR